MTTDHRKRQRAAWRRIPKAVRPVWADFLSRWHEFRALYSDNSLNTRERDRRLHSDRMVEFRGWLRAGHRG